MDQTRVLADRMYSGEGIVADAARIAAANALLVLSAHVAIPLPWTPVPITGQTFGVLLVAVLLGARRSAIALVLYLLEGFVGLPVFQPFGAPGAARFVGPTAGFLLSYPVAAFGTGWLVENGAARSVLRLLGALFTGEFLIFLSGCAWLAFGIDFGWRLAIQQGVLPFLPGEIIKVALIAAAVRGVAVADRSA